jgi:transposase
MRNEQSNRLDFKGQNIYVGIDVHLKSWSVAVLSEHSVLKKFSQNPEPEALYRFLATNYPGANYYSVYEAGFCGFWIHERFRQLGITNIVVNPADVPTMFKEKLRKTDAVDCNKLARVLRSGDLKGIYVPEVETLEIRSLIRLRNSIVKDSTREKNRIKSLLRFHGIEIPEQFTRHSIGNWSRRFLQWLRDVELATEYGKKALDLHIEQFMRLREMLLQETRVIRDLSRSDLFAEPLQLIMSVPGIGITTGISFLVEIDNIRRFKNADQLASYVGLIPMCHSSGEKESVGDITVRKHSILRCNIIEAAWIAIRKDPAMTMAYNEYRKRMNGNKAIVKIARKLVNRIFFVLKRKQKYVPCVVK